MSDGRAQDTAPVEGKPFGLLDLPDELWSKIGEMVIDDTDEIDAKKVQRNMERRRSLSTIKYPGVDCAPPAILRTCKKLRYELSPHYYSTKIDLDSTSGFPHVGSWLFDIGCENRKALRPMHVYFGNYHSQEWILYYLKSCWGFMSFELMAVREIARVVVYEVIFL